MTLEGSNPSRVCRNKRFKDLLGVGAMVSMTGSELVDVGSIPTPLADRLHREELLR